MIPELSFLSWYECHLSIKAIVHEFYSSLNNVTLCISWVILAFHFSEGHNNTCTMKYITLMDKEISTLMRLNQIICLKHLKHELFGTPIWYSYIFNVTLGIVPFAPSFKIQLLFHLFYGLSVNNCTRRKLTIQFLLNCDWNTTFSNFSATEMSWLAGTVTIQLTFIADIAPFQSSFSNLLFKKN